MEKKMINIIRKKHLKKYILIIFLSISSLSNAGEIQGIDLNYITTDQGPFTPEETYFSTIFTDINKINSNGAVSWVESDVQAPGFSIVNDDEVNMSHCFMTSGVNPDDGTIKQCSDPFQSSKRIKLNSNKAGTEIDLVFDVNAIMGATNTYRILEKYLNVTNFTMSDIKIELGFGTANGFVPAVSDIGLDFSDNEGNIWLVETVTGDVNSLSLDALFPFGLFGDAKNDPNHSIDGYFDPNNRARFHLSATRGIIQSTGISANYHDLIGDFMSKSQVLEGIFFDYDDDEETEAATIAHFTDIGWISFRTDQFWADVGMTPPALNLDGTIIESTINAWLSDPLFETGSIEDLANLNLNYHVSIGDISLWPTYDSNFMTAQFTLRISSISTIFKNGFE